jgi:hypothetical protein
MRYRGDDGSGPALSRRQSPAGRDPRASGDRSYPAQDDGLGYPSASSPPGSPAGTGRHRPTGGSAGKGPLRGFPPAPGQPAPLYPPGEFSAWNRRYSGDDTDAGEAPRGASPWQAPGRRARGGRPTGGVPGHGYDDPGPDTDGAARYRSRQHGEPGYADPADSRPGPRGAGNRGYGGPRRGGDGEPDYGEPGYSALAVSEAAADVISTQTWERLSDEPDTGWSRREPDDSGLHRRPGPGQPSRHGAPPAGRPGADDDDTFGGSREPDGPPARGARRAPGGTAERSTAGPARLMAGGSENRGPAGAGRPGTDEDRAGAGIAKRPGESAKRAADTAQRSGGAQPRPGSTAPPGRSRGHGQGTRGRARPHGQRKRQSVVLFGGLAVTVIVVIGIVIALASSGSGTPPPAQTAAGAKASQANGPAPPSSLGTWGYIGSRTTDPQPLSLTELFPGQFASAGVAYSMVVDKSVSNCSQALIGSQLQSAVSSASCTQAMSASYLSGNTGDQQVMGTIGVLNLSTATGAENAGKAAGTSEFVSQLPGTSAPAKSLGTGTGLEAAEAKGHYLVLVWAEFANLKAPTSATQPELESFINLLIEKTANVSLASREVTGKPPS